MPRSRISFRALTVGSFVIAAIVAACQSDKVTGPDESGITKTPGSAVNVSAFLCKAQPKTLSLNCTSADDPTLPSYLIGIDPGTDPSNILIGGQHSNVDITSSNVTNNTTTHQFAFDVTVKNLRPRSIGTIDELVTDSSLKVAFVSGPTTTGGSGNVTVANATGTDFFTAGGQPYFKYGQMLAQNQVSPAKNWVLQYDATVSSFSFLLLVSASVKYPNGYIDVFAPSDSVFAGSTLQMQDSVRDPLGVVTGDQSETWSLGSSADSAKASINAAGLLTATAAGNVTVVATQTTKTGSKVIKIKAPAAKLAVTTHSTTPAQSGVVFAQQPVIQLKDAGNSNVTLAGVVIHAAITSGGGTLGGTDSAATNANGAATFSGLKITGTAGPKVITFTSGALTSVADSITLTAGPAASILVVGASTAVNAGGTVGITATVTDASANPVSGVAVTFTSTSSGGAAPSFSGSNPASTNASGVATINFVTSTTVGVTHTVIGTMAGPKADTTDAITTQGPPTALADSAASNSAPGNPWHGTFNTNFTSAAPGLLANDQLGTPAGTITSFGGGTLGGTVTTNAAGTSATFGGTGSVTVNSNGSITLTPPTGFTGYITFQYRLTNAAGSSDGTVKIAVGARPAANASTYGSTLPGNVGINTSTSTNTKVNATGDALTYHFVSATNGNGALHTDGTYDFNPAVGFTGAGKITFNVSNGFGTSANADVTLNVNAPRIWFVSNDAAVDRDGRWKTPFIALDCAVSCLSTVTTSANDIIYIATGTAVYTQTAPVTLTTGMRIIGQGAPGNFSDAANANVTWPADAGPQPATAGSRPRLTANGTDGFTLGSGNLIRGLRLTNPSTGASITGASVGNLTIGSLSIVSPTTTAISLTTSGNLSVAIDSLVGTTINLVSQSGTFSSSVTRAANLNVTGSAGFSFGDTKVVRTTAGTGVNLSNNTGTTTFTTLVDSTSAGAGLTASNAGTLSIGGGLIYAVGGIALDLQTVAMTGAGFSSVTSSGNSGSGINLQAVTGTVALGGGSSTSTGAGSGINIGNATSATVSYSGSLSSTSGRPVNINNSVAGACPALTLSGAITGTANGVLVQNCSSGTMTLSGAITLSTTTNKAIQLATNTGATINFTGGAMALATTTGAGFDATGGGTVSVTGANNSISTGAATALNVTNTTIGANGVTFKSVSANGGTNGIVLNNTGTSGGLTVAGTGSVSSGGTIQNTTGSGILLTTTKNASFNNMNIQSTGGSGVRGTTAVTNFSFTNGTINNSGTGGGNQESSIAFNDPTGSATDAKVTGTVTITGNTLTNALWHGVSILQFAGQLDDVNISNNVLTSGLTTGAGGNSFGSGIQLVPGGVDATSSNLTRAELNGNTITNFPGGVLIAVQCGTANGSGPLANCGTVGSATNDVEIKNNLLNGGGVTIKPNQIMLVTVNGRGQGQFTIQNNGSVADPLSGSAGNIIDISAGGAVTVQATVTGNRIDAAGQTVSGTSGIAAGVGPFTVTGPTTLSTATLYATVQNNVVVNSAGSGIRLNVNAGDPTLNGIVTGNTVGAPISATYGIQVVEGNNAGFTGNVNLQISTNTTTGGTGGGNTFPGIGLRKFGTATGEFNILGLSPSPATNAQMESYVSGQNPASASGTFGTGGTAAVNGTSSNWTVAPSVPQPASLP